MGTLWATTLEIIPRHKKVKKMANKRNNRFIVENQIVFHHFYTILKQLTLSRFKWYNLPETMDERMIELTLFEKGYCLLFKDEIIGYLSLPCTIGGELDVYNIPIERTAIANNGYQYHCDKSDSVLVFNNYLHTPGELMCRIYANKLYSLSRAIDVNVNAQKTPVVGLCDKNLELTVINALEQYDGNKPFILFDKNLDLNSIFKTLDLQSPYVADKLQIQMHQTLNEYLTFIGVNNANMDKRERMITNEVDSNVESVNIFRNVDLNSRKEACKKFNQMYGTDISVEYDRVVDYSVSLYDDDHELSQDFNA